MRVCLYAHVRVCHLLHPCCVCVCVQHALSGLVTFLDDLDDLLCNALHRHVLDNLNHLVDGFRLLVIHQLHLGFRHHHFPHLIEG